MFNEKAKSTDLTVASVSAGVGSQELVRGGGVFHFKCYDKDGNLKWEDTAHNLVVNQGLQDMNTQYFKGSNYSAAWYLGLVNNSNNRQCKVSSRSYRKRQEKTLHRRNIFGWRCSQSKQQNVQNGYFA